MRSHADATRSTKATGPLPLYLTLQLQSSASFVVQKVLLLFPTRLQVDEEQYDAETGDTHGRQEVKRCGSVVRRYGIDDSATDNGTDKRRGFAGNVEERKKEEILASRCDFGDLNVSFSSLGVGVIVEAEEHIHFNRVVGSGKTHHCLRIAVPWANHETVPDIVHPKFPSMMEAYCFGPDPSHTIYVNGGNTDGACVEHCLSGEMPPALDVHER